MIKKVTISSVMRMDKDRNGNPFKTRDGRDYTRLLIKAIEYGDQLISGFGGNWNKDWKEGDEQTIDIEEVNKDGKRYLNFKRVDLTDHLMEMVKDLHRRVLNLEEWRDTGVNRGNYNGQPNFNVSNDIPDDEPPLESLEDYVG